MEKIKILNKNIDEIYDIFNDLGFKNYRTDQVFDWIYEKNIVDFDEMTNISKKMRNTLKSRFISKIPGIVTKQKSKDGTIKFSLALQDKEMIEMVLIPGKEKEQYTLCISSQVGCSRRCKFCATARLGLIRNLEVAEIIGQVILAKKYLQGTKLSNIVFMGMGEPLDNLKNVLKSVDILRHEKGMKFSPRRITISTCGVVDKIEKLYNSKLKFKLAVSLNSGIDDKRNKIMPVNKHYNLVLLRKSLMKYSKGTPHRITLEYIAIKNFNMKKSDVIALKNFTKNISCKINLIPWNPIENSNFKRPTENELIDFQNKLMKETNKTVTIRFSKGDDIAAACGQLVTKKSL